MSQFAIADAAHRLDELVKESQAGREVILTRDDHPVARIVSLAPPGRRAGTAQHLPHHMADDFDATPDGFEDYT